MSRINISISRDWAPIRLGTLTRALPLLLVLAVLLTAGALSQAQSNFTVIHTFTGQDGGVPLSAPTSGQTGQPVWDNALGRSKGDGLVYELAHVNGSWILYPLYSFTGQSDGQDPWGGSDLWPRRYALWQHRGSGVLGDLWHAVQPQASSKHRVRGCTLPMD